jgi:D-glycero-D-manno-heptose 1,7-bisphosphate phosphatase
MSQRCAVFLDRDDTLIQCNDLPPPPPPGVKGDLADPARVALLPGVREGCTRLITAGYVLIIITNQGGAARGAVPLAGVEAVNDALRNALGLPALLCYFCPVHPKGNIPHLTSEHTWRKPAPGMLEAAARECNITLADSWLIGDAVRDVEAGVAAGLLPDRCLRVGTELTFTQAVDRVVNAPGL